MFRTSYVHHQEDYNVHAALYGVFCAEIIVKGFIKYLKYEVIKLSIKA
jgi:hypothetical protein